MPIRRNWHSGDTIRLQLPVTVRRVKSRSEVTANTGLIAIERGPFVYCVEGIDNGGSIDGLHLTPNAQFAVSHRDNLLGGLNVIEWDNFTAVPYYSGSNRGVGAMAVWLPWKDN